MAAAAAEATAVEVVTGAATGAVVVVVGAFGEAARAATVLSPSRVGEPLPDGEELALL